MASSLNGTGVTFSDGSTLQTNVIASNSIGSYVYAINQSTTSVAYGSTIAGSNIKPISMGVPVNSGTFVANTEWSVTSNTLSGTWRCMSYSNYTANPRYGIALWVRIS